MCMSFSNWAIQHYVQVLKKLGFYKSWQWRNWTLFKLLLDLAMAAAPYRYCWCLSRQSKSPLTLSEAFNLGLPFAHILRMFKPTSIGMSSTIARLLDNWWNCSSSLERLFCVFLTWLIEAFSWKPLMVCDNCARLLCCWSQGYYLDNNEGHWHSLPTCFQLCSLPPAAAAFCVSNWDFTITIRS